MEQQPAHYDQDPDPDAEVIIMAPPKKKKIVVKKREIARIPECTEYAEFVKSEYKVNELKDVCKHYGIKCSGTKPELKDRIYTHLIQSHFIKRIQRAIRRNFVKRHSRMSGPAYSDRSLCVNESDFYSMELMGDIPCNQFISFKDDTGMIYGFDVMSLYTYYGTHYDNDNGPTTPPANPYNRMKFPSSLSRQMYRKIRLTNILGVPCKIKPDPEPVLSMEERDDQILFAAFQQINSHGHYSDSAWFSELNFIGIMRFMRELSDIWNYRAQLLPQLKQQICPPHGNPFSQVDLRCIPVRPDVIKHDGIQVIHTFVTSGINRDSQSLGAYYVLSALTLVSAEARAAMPWLYESVVYTPSP
jgi:hypothetical protein